MGYVIGPSIRIAASLEAVCGSLADIEEWRASFSEPRRASVVEWCLENVVNDVEREFVYPIRIFDSDKRMVVR